MTYSATNKWLSFALLAATPAAGQVAPENGEGSGPADSSLIVCSSAAGERRTCAADTSTGIRLLSSSGVCELGRTWGYDESGVWVAEDCSAEFAPGAAPRRRFDDYTPTAGFRVVDAEHGDLNIRVFSYLQYLNQSDLDESYTNAFGQTLAVQQRRDFQINKAQVYFFGWIMSPKLRYVTYVWSSNASQGRDAQVVVAGNFNYAINDNLTVGGGIGSLPGVRTTGGTFPHWLSVDARQIADEFFRPSYTTGVWVEGRVRDDLRYNVMLGNNLSQLGVDASQLDDSLDTWSGALAWMPATGEFGTASGFGDYDEHAERATKFGLRFTRSDENRTGQPDTDAFENVQLRLSDGSVIFAPDLFGAGIQIDDALYRMLAVEAGIKHRGYSLEFEYYRRWIDDFRGPGTTGLPFDGLDDDGFQLQASAMLRPRTLQVYAGGSKVFGEYGEPWDVRVGVNWFPWQNQALRWNFEVMKLDRSPVGALSLPYSVGASGHVFRTNFMLWL